MPCKDYKKEKKDFKKHFEEVEKEKVKCKDYIKK